MMFALPHTADSVTVSVYENGYSGSFSTVRCPVRSIIKGEEVPEEHIRFSRHDPQYGGAVPERSLTNDRRSRELCLTQGSDDTIWSHSFSESKGDLIDPLSGRGP